MLGEPLSILAEAAGTAGPPAFRFAIAGSMFALSGPRQLVDVLSWALCHHQHAAGGGEEVALFTWHGAPSPLERAPRHWQVEDRWARREPVWASDGSGAVVFDPIGGIVTLYDAQRQRGGIWIERPGSVPSWIEAAPLLRLFDAHFIRKGCMVCHGGAISGAGGAVFIAGPGGAGKSTLACRAPQHGFGYLGDDYVLIDGMGARPRIHNLYGSAKLVPNAWTERHPEYLQLKGLGDDRDDGKAVFSVAPANIIGSAPLALVVAPVVGAGDGPAIDEITAAAALRAILPSALRQLPGDEQRKLDVMARALRVRAIRLNLSPSTAHDLDTIAAALQPGREAVPA